MDQEDGIPTGDVSALFERYVSGDLDSPARARIRDELDNNPNGPLAALIREHIERARQVYDVRIWNSTLVSGQTNDESTDDGEVENAPA